MARPADEAVKDTEFLPAFPVWQTAIPGQTGETNRKGLNRRKRNNEGTKVDRRKHPYTENCDIVYPVKCGGQRPEERKTASPVFAYWEGKTGRVEGRVKKKESGSEKPCGSEREALEHEEGSGTTGFEGSMQGERERSGQAECEAGSGDAVPAGETVQKSSTRQKLEQTGQAECEAGSGNAAPAGEPAQKRSTRRKQEQTGQAEREAGSKGSPPAGEPAQKRSMRQKLEQTGQAERKPGCRDAAPAGKPAQKRSTRRKQEQTGQPERESGCRGSPPAPAGEPAQKHSARRKQEQIGQAEREPGCRGSPPAVADAEEVLAALTRILRGEEEAKTSEVLRAAELLGRQYGLFGDREGAPAEPPKIVMDVPGREEKQ